MLGFSPLGTTALGSPTANEAHTMQVTSGTFTLSMQGAGKLITDIYPTGTFTLSGQSVGLSAGRPSTFTTGSFTLSGQNIDFDQNFGLIIDSVYNSATFTYAGQNIVFDTGFGMVLASGSFTSSGQSVDFTKQMNIGADTGTFTLTGQDALKGISDVISKGIHLHRPSRRHDCSTLFWCRNSKFTYSFNEFKIRGWLTPNVPAEIWTDVA